MNYKKALEVISNMTFPVSDNDAIFKFSQMKNIATEALNSQERMYSEEEVIDFARWVRIHDNLFKNEVWTIQQLRSKYELELQSLQPKKEADTEREKTLTEHWGIKEQADIDTEERNFDIGDIKTAFEHGRHNDISFEEMIGQEFKNMESKEQPDTVERKK